MADHAVRKAVCFVRDIAVWPLDQRESALRLAAAVALGAAIAVALIASMTGPTKDDIAWLLYVADRWLDGGRLYVDLVEVNPPLIVWLCAVPTLIARWLHLSAADVAIPFFGAIVLGCVGWAVAVIDRSRLRFGDPLVTFTVCAMVVLLVPAIEFGQREHLLVAAALPYLAVVGCELAGDAPGPAVAIGAAVLAAIGCALKPRYVLAFGLVEIYAVWQGLRLWRPATLAAASALAAYVVAVFAFEPAFFRAAIPMAFALYGATDVPFLDLLFDCRLLIFGLTVAIMLMATRPIEDARGKLLAALLVFAIGATMECFLQGKNWFYHRLPATIAAILCLLAWASLRLRAEWRPGWRLRGPGLLVAVALMAFGLRAYERLSHELAIAFAHDENTGARLAALIRREHAKSYVAFSDWIGLGFPVVNNTGVVWASRFDSMWAVDGEMWRAAQDGHAPEAWPMRQWVVADFRRACPDLVVVDRHAPIDYVGLLGRSDPAFLRLWRHYERIAAFDNLVVFRRVPANVSTRGDSCSAPQPMKG